MALVQYLVRVRSAVAQNATKAVRNTVKWVKMLVNLGPGDPLRALAMLLHGAVGLFGQVWCSAP